MKKRFLAIVTMIAIVATMVCMGSMVTSAEVKYEDPLIMNYSHADWFNSEKVWAEHVVEEDGVKVIRWLADGGNININGQGNWGRPFYGQEIVRTDSDQYLRLYDKSNEATPGYDASKRDGWSNYYYRTSAASKSAGIADPLKLEIVVRKVGSDWENATDTDVSYGLAYYSASHEAWGLHVYFTEQLLAGQINDWFTITAEVLIPADWADVGSVQMIFKHGKDTNRELHVQTISAYVPIDMSNVPEVTPETATFDGSAPADITVTVDLKGYALSPVKYNGVAMKKGADKDYVQSEDKTQITFNKSWLATLENGDHEVTIPTPGGDCKLVITVTNANPSQGGGNNSNNTDAPAKGGCGGIITATSAVLASMLLAGAMLVFKKKD